MHGLTGLFEKCFKVICLQLALGPNFSNKILNWTPIYMRLAWTTIMRKGKFGTPVLWTLIPKSCVFLLWLSSCLQETKWYLQEYHSIESCKRYTLTLETNVSLLAGSHCQMTQKAGWGVCPRQPIPSRKHKILSLLLVMVEECPHNLCSHICR